MISPRRIAFCCVIGNLNHRQSSSLEPQSRSDVNLRYFLQFASKEPSDESKLRDRDQQLVQQHQIAC